MSTFFPASQRGLSQFGMVDRRNVFAYANDIQNRPKGFGRLRVLNEYTIAPGGVLNEAYTDVKIVIIVLEGCLVGKGHSILPINLTPGQARLLLPGELENLSIQNPSPFESLRFIELWFESDLRSEQHAPNDAVIDIKAFTAPKQGWEAVIGGGSPFPGAPEFTSKVFYTRMHATEALEYTTTEDHMAWLYVIGGHVHLNDQSMNDGDSFALPPGQKMTLNDGHGTCLLLVDTLHDPGFFSNTSYPALSS